MGNADLGFNEKGRNASVRERQNYLLMGKSAKIYILNFKDSDMKKNTILETTFSKYKILGQIGQGGSGTVFKVEDEDSNVFALKIISPTEANTEKAKRFKNEINFCSKTTHPNIVKIVDTGFYFDKEAKCQFYIMPQYGGTLRNLIKESIQPENILRIFSKVLDGVEAAHLQGIFHRDLKPENILVNQNEVVIADFGIARFRKEQLLTLIDTKPNTRLANFFYAAPEQKIQGANVDHRADIFALGLILNEMFTKNIPYGEGYKKIKEISSQHSYLDDLVAEMIHQSLERRPNSIEEIKLQLKTRENEFISLQRIDKLKNEVVPIGKLSDELTFSPVELNGIDFDHQNFIFELNQTVNEDWIRIYKNIGDRGWGLNGAYPDQMIISQHIIYVNCTGENMQLISSSQLVTDKVKQYINTSNVSYKEFLAKKRQNEERLLVENQKMKEKQIHEKIQQEEKRLEILANIKI